jgi:hypothetical protein
MLGLGGATSLSASAGVGSSQKGSLRSLPWLMHSAVQGCRPARLKRRQFEGRLLRYWRLLAPKLPASRKREHKPDK